VSTPIKARCEILENSWLPDFFPFIASEYWNSYTVVVAAVLFLGIAKTAIK